MSEFVVESGLPDDDDGRGNWEYGLRSVTSRSYDVEGITVISRRVDGGRCGTETK